MLKEVKDGLKLLIWYGQTCSTQIAESIIFQEQQLMNQFDFWQAKKESRNVKNSL